MVGYFLLLAVAAILVGITCSPYVSGVLSHCLTVVIPALWMSDRKLRMPASFDRGDAALKAGDPVRALACYREELGRAPDDPELFLRLAKAHRALGAGGQVVACLREAVRCASEPHRKGPILLMLSEVLARPGEAEEVLSQVLATPALSGYHDAARRRLSARISPDCPTLP